MQSRRIVLVPLAVSALWLLFIVLGNLITVAFQILEKLGFPLIIRLIGLVVILASSLLFCWFFTYRNPIDVLTSTYVTFLKMTKRLPLGERSSRTEPLVVEGPYRYVRHPLYSCVVLLVFGLWLLLDYSSLLVATILFLLWFNFVVAPFEERELKAIFGQKYDEYAKQVPRTIPIRHHRNTE
jgi:hypothetical protein